MRDRRAFFFVVVVLALLAGSAWAQDRATAHGDLAGFLNAVGGRVSVVNFDADSVGHPLDAAKGIPAATVDDSRWGLRFSSGTISTGAAVSRPNLITAGADEARVAGRFRRAVRGVGLTGVGPVVLTVFDASGRPLGQAASDAEPGRSRFVGLVASDSSIASFELTGPEVGWGGDDLLYGPEPAKEPFDFTIDAEVRPIQAEVTDAEGEVHGLGAALNPGGGLEQFADDLVMIRTSDLEELRAFQDRRGGVLLRTDDLPAFPADVIPPSQIRAVRSLGYKLLRVDLSTVDLRGFRGSMQGLGASGLFRFSSERAARLVALVADERLHGHEVSLNPLLLPGQAPPPCLINRTQEQGLPGPPAPTAAPWADGFAMPWYNTAATTIGMTRAPSTAFSTRPGAWPYLDFLRMNTPAISVAVIDGGFFTGGGLGSVTPLGLDDVSAPIIDLKALVTGGVFSGLNVPNSTSCTGGTPCPFHGTNMVDAAVGGLNNRFGAVGPGGQVVSRLMTYHAFPFMFDANVGIVAATAAGANVISMSWGGPCFFLCGALGPALALNDSIVLAIGAGVTPVAAAGNENGSVEVSDTLPCRLPRLVVVVPIPVPFPPFVIHITQFLPFPLPGTI